MMLFLTYDANAEAGLDYIISQWNKSNIDKHFEAKNYGDDLVDLSMFLICRNPALNFKQRIRFSKKEKRLYVDLMLDLNVLKKISDPERKKIVADKITSEIPPIIKKYGFKNFDLETFQKDLATFFRTVGWSTALVN